MKVVALISGGKDSCYNMLLCQRHGHRIVALANLLPADPGTDELDSYMYQTVGHQVVAAYAQCMGLPLFRRKITGRSKDQRLVYEDTAGDEVEDLVALLAFVKQAVPGIQAVSSGAIASDYQRTRVERACARLGLVSLAFMWHQPQGPLLQHMVDADIGAVLVKVAAAGLRPDRHLGASLAAMQPQLHALRERYGINVCGEGGEYETLTLDCPLFGFGRIVLDEWRAVVLSPDSMAPVALLHPTAFHVEPKLSASHLDSAAEQLPGSNAEVIEVPDDYAPAQHATTPPPAPSGTDAAPEVELRATRGSCYVSLAAQVAGTAADFASAEATAAALSAALQRVDDALPTAGLTWGDALFVHLYVPAMAHFAAANTAYERFLPAVNPPARATVQLAPSGQAAMVVDVLLARPGGATRHVLHVQSISEWAPSCIGPYSQALAHRGLVHFAGQIPLDPASMAIAPGSTARQQSVRSMASCAAVAVAMRTDLARSMLWCTVYCADAAGQPGRQAAEAVLHHYLRAERSAESGDSSAGEDEEEALDDYLVAPAMHRHWEPLMTYISVPQLPRGAMVEIQPAAWAEDRDAPEPESSSSDEDGQRRRGPTTTASGQPLWIRQLEVTESAGEAAGLRVRVSCLASSSRFARVQAVVAAGPGTILDCQHVETAAAHAATLAAASLSASGFAVEDVATVKLYHSSEALRAAGGDAASLSTAVADALGGSVSPVHVPVTAVGSNAAVDAALLLELFAVKP